MIVVFDTETTGLVDDKVPFEHPAQPRIVQLAAALYGFDRKRLASFDVLCQPPEGGVPKEVEAIHGLTTEKLRKAGIPEAAAVAMFMNFYNLPGVTTFVAHNVNFDLKVIECALARMGRRPERGLDKPRCCTMKEMAPVCAIPQSWGGGFKWPSLEEAYRAATGRDLEGAHDALVDLQACAEIYWWILGENTETEQDGIETTQPADEGLERAFAGL